MNSDLTYRKLCTVKFGKHYGSKFQDVLESDPDYCEWVMKTESEDYNFNYFKEWLEFIEKTD